MISTLSLSTFHFSAVTYALFHLKAVTRVLLTRLARACIFPVLKLRLILIYYSSTVMNNLRIELISVELTSHNLHIQKFFRFLKTTKSQLINANKIPQNLQIKKKKTKNKRPIYQL